MDYVPNRDDGLNVAVVQALGGSNVGSVRVTLCPVLGWYHVSANAWTPIFWDPDDPGAKVGAAYKGSGCALVRVDGSLWSRVNDDDGDGISEAEVRAAARLAAALD